MRSHSVSAEGGTAAVLFEDEGDTIESHIYDTVKGSDFLADQDVAERLCVEMPKEIYQILQYLTILYTWILSNYRLNQLLIP